LEVRGWKSNFQHPTSKHGIEVLKMEKSQKAQLLGRYIVIDPDICHGKPTFRGTRIMVQHVLEQVAAGMAWDAIVQEWRGSVSKDDRYPEVSGR
jgi:uncharacterized protein (DUF433 family)